MGFPSISVRGPVILLLDETLRANRVVLGLGPAEVNVLLDLEQFAQGFGGEDYLLFKGPFFVDIWFLFLKIAVIYFSGLNGRE